MNETQQEFENFSTRPVLRSTGDPSDANAWVNNGDYDWSAWHGRKTGNQNPDRSNLMPVVPSMGSTHENEDWSAWRAADSGALSKSKSETNQKKDKRRDDNIKTQLTYAKERKKKRRKSSTQGTKYFSLIDKLRGADTNNNTENDTQASNTRSEFSYSDINANAVAVPAQLYYPALSEPQATASDLLPTQKFDTKTNGTLIHQNVERINGY